jgi:probable HAF family extracellular repeat protein
MNDYGQVVGHSQIVNPTENLPHAFLWTPSSPNSTSGSMIDLGTFMSPGDSSAVAINSQGWVTGNAGVPLSQQIGDVISVDHAFLWKPTSVNGTTGTMIDLGTLDPNADGGLGQSEGLAINRSGVVVGQSNPTGATSQNQNDAVIWQPASNGSYILSDLNSLIPSGSGWTLLRADAINDSGQIVVEATNSSLSGQYALLLTPSTATAAVLAQAATSPKSTVSPTAALSGTLLAPFLANPPSGSLGFDLTAVSVSPAPSQPLAALVATSPVVPLSQAPLLVSSLTSNRTPESALHPWWRAAPSVATALDQVFADLDSGQLSESLEA